MKRLYYLEVQVDTDAEITEAQFTSALASLNPESVEVCDTEELTEDGEAETVENEGNDSGNGD